MPQVNMRTDGRDEIVWQRRALLDCGHRLKKHHTRRARPARVSRCALGAVSTRVVWYSCVYSAGTFRRQQGVLQDKGGNPDRFRWHKLTKGEGTGVRLKPARAHRGTETVDSKVHRRGKWGESGLVLKPPRSTHTHRVVYVLLLDTHRVEVRLNNAGDNSAEDPAACRISPY